MPDIMDLIAEILDNPKLKNVASKIQSEYHDEPILRTAAQMARRLPEWGTAVFRVRPEAEILFP